MRYSCQGGVDANEILISLSVFIIAGMSDMRCLNEAKILRMQGFTALRVYAVLDRNLVIALLAFLLGFVPSAFDIVSRTGHDASRIFISTHSASILLVKHLPS